MAASLPTLDEVRQVVREELRAAVAELRATLPPAPLVSVEEAARLRPDAWTPADRARLALNGSPIGSQGRRRAGPKGRKRKR